MTIYDVIKKAKHEEISMTSLNTKANAPEGYCISIKGYFFLKIHNYLNDFSPIVKNVAVKKDLLSPYILSSWNL
ncbi:hypothetical protein C1645_839511 [Glomus cerebriforme]|uniref:Uncharacterized protein n=1 Tax=Glomus cerebriforme TaxID=658196 RepID=A0A397SB64_9GLOM|nr:hypothetical protein C1645_839511 [Glomus cerebriforme]